MLLAGQREPQRQKQRPSAPPGAQLQRLGPGGPDLRRPTAPAAAARARRAGTRPRPRSPAARWCRPPRPTSRAPRRAGRDCRAPRARTPRSPPPAGGDATAANSQPVQHAPVQRLQLRDVEPRRGGGEMREIEIGDQLVQARRHRVARRAEAGEIGGDRRRLDAVGAQPAQRQPLQALGQLFALRRPIAAADARSRSRAGSPPSAASRSSCTPVLVTWSSPRITCVTAVSRSSTTEQKV